MTPGHDAVQKVTLIPRGQARGLTWFIPGEDPTLISKQQIFARIVGALGGRATEEVVFGDAEVTTGASSDLQQVTSMAKQVKLRNLKLELSSIGELAVSQWFICFYRVACRFTCCVSTYQVGSAPFFADGYCVWHVRYRSMGVDGPIFSGWRYDHADDGKELYVREVG